MKKFVLSGGACLAALTLSLHAQTQAPANPANTLQQINGPTGSQGSASDVTALQGENHDLDGLAVVKTYPVPKTITAFTSQSVFWTNNAFLQRNSEVSAFGYSGRFGVTYVPYSTRDWTPSVSFAYQIIRYDRTSVLDFEAMTLTFGSKYNLTKDGSWSISNTYSLQQLNSPRLNLGDFYNESFFDNQISYVKAISEKHNIYFLASGEIGWRLTDPGTYSRIDNALLFSVIYAPDPAVRLQAYVRPAAYIYTDDKEFNFQSHHLDTGRERDDFNISAGVLATWTPIEQVAVNTNLSWTGNYSNVGFRQYSAYTPTLTVSASYSF